MADRVETYYRTDPKTGEVKERTVATPRDAVQAKFAGYRPKKTDKADTSDDAQPQ